MTLNDAQIWTVIGVFAAAMASVISLVIMTINAKLGRFEVKFGAQLAAINSRLDVMDKDIHALMKHTFGIDRE